MIQRVYLILKELLSGRFISLIVFISILASSLSFSLFQIIGENFNGYIKNKFSSSIPPNTIKISAKPEESFLFFKVRNPKNPVFDDAMLNKIRALKGVAGISPFMIVKVPIQARISLFSLEYTTDLLCIGAPHAFIADDLKGEVFQRMWAAPDMEKNIPALFPSILIKAYNEGMAEPNRLPKIDENTVMGMGFDILFGYSSIRKDKDYIKVTATVAGFTEKINSLALIIPIKAAEFYNKKFNPDNYKNEYVYAFVKTSDHKSLLSASAELQGLGLAVEVEKKVSDSILALEKNVNLVLDVLKYFIIILAVAAISFSTMIATYNRIEYYRILRILGASKYFISFTILLKYIALGFGGASLGLWLIRYFAGAITGAINISIIKISLSIPESLYRNILIAGAVIPALSTLPGLFRLFSKRLNRD